MNNPNSRFYECDGEGFPSVANYDYETNIAVRGVENREFRWEEVSLQTTYLFKEATSGGTFEDNTYRSDFSITNPTGVNFITTGNANTGSYVGWTLTGRSIIYIGATGLFLHTGNLTGISGAFQAHPIEGNESLGLYFTGAEVPTLYSNLLATGLEGPFILDGDHQFYLQTKLNYGSTGYLQAYIRGWQAGSIVAYYNPFNFTWDVTAPTGLFGLGTGGYTTIKYRFTAASFPATTPSSFDIYISSVQSGTFVTIDDVHVDAFMERNAFVDYVVPDGYMIQLTPDLGWHDISAMFESNQNLPNPHLKTLGPFRVELANLVDNLDNSVTATIDEDIFLGSTTSTFKKYLWRALPLTPNGQPGPGGLPTRFEYIGDSINLFFSIDAVQEDDLSNSKTILGTRSSTMTILVDGVADHPGLSYPTDTTWKLIIELNAITRSISLQALDVTGVTSAVKRVLLTSKLYEQNYQAVWNVFDEHGLKADLERLPTESNYDYSLRIKDVYINKGGPYFLGVVNGATRELGLRKISDALSFFITTNNHGIFTTEAIDIEVTSYSLRVSASSFTITEKLLVDPIYHTITLAYRPKEFPVFSILTNQSKIDQKDITLQEYAEDSVAVYRFKINNPAACGQFIEVTYQYDIEFLFKTYEDLYSLIIAVNNITDPSGVNIIRAIISPKLSGNESAMGLFLSELTLNTKDGVTVSWSPVYLKKISDRGYRDYFLENSSTNLKNTEYYSYVAELKKNTKIFWGSVESDRDRWDAADSKNLSMDSIPTLFDPPITKIVSTVTGGQIDVEAVNAWGRGYVGFNNEFMSNLGLSSDLFQPGVAHRKDLQPTIFLTTSQANVESPLSDNIGPIKNNNNYFIFSGQK